MKFTKKPVTINAIQWTGTNLREVICFTDGPPDVRHSHAAMKWEEYCDLVARDGLKIFTLEGKMSAAVGDWIIKGVKGEHYPCKPDIFALTYEDTPTAPVASAPAQPMKSLKDIVFDGPDDPHAPAQPVDVDAERYRWLRSEGGATFTLNGLRVRDQTYDDAIDAAHAALATQQGDKA